jgi:MFS transporter, OFA family, oxalate/formate antiporter
LASSSRRGWRHGWVAIGTTALAVGFRPVWLFLVRRPEDVGLVPDRITASAAVIALLARHPRPAAA